MLKVQSDNFDHSRDLIKLNKSDPFMAELFLQSLVTSFLSVSGPPGELRIRYERFLRELDETMQRFMNLPSP